MSAEPAEEPLAALSRCRMEIEDLDRRLVSLLADRVTLGLETARLKRAAGLPILDPQREAEVIRRSAETARQHNLPEEEVRGIFWHIVGLARRAQQGDE